MACFDEPEFFQWLPEPVPGDRDACLTEFGAVLRDNRLIHTVGRRLPLRDIATAHELSERGEIIGNIVLDVGS